MVSLDHVEELEGPADSMMDLACLFEKPIESHSENSNKQLVI
jgi:hypothetical protein